MADFDFSGGQKLERLLDSIEEKRPQDRTQRLIYSIFREAISLEEDEDQQDFLKSEEIEDLVAGLLIGGTGVTIDYNDAAGELTLTAPTSQLTDEEVQDIVGGFTSGGNNTTVNYDDANGILILNMDAHAADHENGGSDEIDAGNLDGSSGTSGQVLRTDGAASFWDNPMSSSGAFTYVQDSQPSSPSEGETWYDTGADEAYVYNGTDFVLMTTDNHDELGNIGPSDHHAKYTDEEAQDAVNALLQGGTNITLNYDDANNTLTISSTTHSVSDDGSAILSDPNDINFGTALTVTDDLDGTVTIDSSDTDTRTNVSDNGSQIVSDVQDINFGTDLSVTDDTDGTVTVDAVSTDTRTNVSDDGSQIVSDVSDINFGTNISVTDDNDGTVTVDATGSGNASTYTESVTIAANSTYTVNHSLGHKYVNTTFWDSNDEKASIGQMALDSNNLELQNGTSNSISGTIVVTA